MALLSSAADQGLELARGTGKAVADQGLKLARGTGKAACSAGTTCLSAADTVRRNVPGMARKLERSTGKAAWIAGTSAIVLVVPLMIVADREHMLSQMEDAHMSLLGTGGRL